MKEAHIVILPCGTVVFENLTTSIVNIDGLLGELKNRSLTGYIAVNADKFSGTLFLRAGKLVNAVEDGNGSVVGGAAVAAIMRMCRSDDVRIDVHETSEELLNALIGFAKSKRIHENLTSGFVSLDKLLATLEQQRHTGYLEVVMGSEVGMVLFEDGRPIDSIHRRKDGATVAGADALDGIMDAAKKKNTVINVYQSEIESLDYEEEEIVVGEAIEIRTVIDLYERIISKMEKSIDKLLGGGKFAREFAFAMKLRGSEGLTYNHGAIDYNGDLPWNDLVDVLNAILDETITGLSHIIPRHTIMSNLRANMKDLSELYGDDIDRFGIYNIIGR